MEIIKDEDTEWHILEEDAEDTFYPHHQIISRINKRKEYVFLCIDVGIVNLGLSLITADFQYRFKNVVGVDLVDITIFRCDKKKCHLKHDKTFVDWVNHLLQHFEIVFKQVNHIIIERQPPSGLVAVEQLIMNKYRNKTSLVHPSSMHKYFNINNCNYDERKRRSQKIAESNMKIDYVKSDYLKHKRKHDIADSICLGLFWLNQIRKEKCKHVAYIKHKEFLNKPSCLKGMNISEFFETFKFKN